MASQYSHLQFFRRVPNVLLARYFVARDAALEIDWTQLGETDVEAVLAAFLTLSAEQQGEFEAEFQDVHALACEGGVAALLDEADFHPDDNFVHDLSAIEGFHAKMMWAFLENPSTGVGQPCSCTQTM